jgi:CrcB protein
MTVATILVIAVGGALGACLRALVERWVTERQRGDLPWGLFAVNVLGSAVAGAVAAGTEGVGRTFLLVGICGALTTYSGFGAAVHRLWSLDRRAAWITIVGMTVGCIAVAALTFALVSRAS